MDDSSVNSNESLTEHSSDSDCSLDLSFNSSLFAEEDGVLRPYQFEPCANLDSGDQSDAPERNSADSNEWRLTDNSWCSCGRCQLMTQTVECVCCREYQQILEKLEVDGVSDSCITQHPGFSSVSLNVWVLQVAGFQIRQEHGRSHLPSAINECYRYTAYRQLVRWCWGWLGQDVRVVIPSCAIIAIRNAFPSPDNVYTGFQYPSIS